MGPCTVFPITFHALISPSYTPFTHLLFSLYCKSSKCCTRVSTRTYCHFDGIQCLFHLAYQLGVARIPEQNYFPIPYWRSNRRKSTSTRQHHLSRAPFPLLTPSGSSVGLENSVKNARSGVDSAVPISAHSPSRHSQQRSHPTRTP
jgi:hypothetical protein